MSDDTQGEGKNFFSRLYDSWASSRKDKRIQAVLASPEYQLLETERNTLQTQQAELVTEKADLEERIEGLQSDVAVQVAKVETQSGRIVELETVNSDYKQRVDTFQEMVGRLESEPAKKLGTQIMDGPSFGVIELNSKNDVVYANETACTYLGVDLEDLMGKKVSNIATPKSYLEKFMSVFEIQSDELARRDVRFDQTTFDINGQPMSLAVYPITDSRNQKYEGSFMMLYPHKSLGFMRRATEGWKAKIILDEVVTVDTIVDLYLRPIMDSGTKAVYIHMNQLKHITTGALDTLSKCYHALVEKERQCHFRFVPLDVALYLTEERGVVGIKKIATGKNALSSENDIARYLVNKSAEEVKKTDFKLEDGLEMKPA